MRHFFVNFKLQVSHPAGKILFLVLFWNGTLKKKDDRFHMLV